MGLSDRDDLRSRAATPDAEVGRPASKPAFRLDWRTVVAFILLLTFLARIIHERGGLRSVSVIAGPFPPDAGGWRVRGASFAGNAVDARPSFRLPRPRRREGPDWGRTFPVGGHPFPFISV
jgi:hypothetical protein